MLHLRVPKDIATDHYLIWVIVDFVEVICRLIIEITKVINRWGLSC
jgi:hypothetical protein